MEAVRQGKVRDLYADGDDLLLVASDRVSAFDVVLPTPVPGKGIVLTALSRFWFGRIAAAGIVADHLVDGPVPERFAGRATRCRRLDMLPVEFVVRGHLEGSGWYDYQATGEVSGHALPAGLVQGDRLPTPLLTPATKADAGDHDQNVTEEQAAELVGAGRYAAARRASLLIFALASRHAAERGIIVADTKFEFGVDPRGGDPDEVVLADEVLTPDSSRFWPADRWAPGSPQPSFDKQYVREYLMTLPWDRTPPGPELPPEVVAQTRARYLEAYERLAGATLDLDAAGAR